MAQCAACGGENLVSSKFCGHCGASLGSRCPGCGAANPREFRFCGECGTSLATTPEPRALPGETSERPLDAERRFLTVLFSDLVNSSDIASRLDPEEWRSLAAEYRHAASEAVSFFGGYVAQHLGDGLVAYFGYPEAHDKDPEAAVRAGLRIVDAVSALNGGRGGSSSRPALAVRVGIHSGHVVVGRGSNQWSDVFGEAPNVAARVQAMALPGSVWITSALHRMVSGLFTFLDRGDANLKGIPQPMRLYQVTAATRVRGGLHAVASRELTPLAGREEEMTLLLNRWRRVAAGEGQVALIIGEPGIGKSRLVNEFSRRIQRDPHDWIEGACDQFAANTPFHAIRQMLELWVLRSPRAEPRDRTRLLADALKGAGLDLKQSLALMAEFLEFPPPAGFVGPQLSPEQRRRRVLSTVASWVFGAARRIPLVIVLEDLHWADPSTLELIRALAEQNQTQPLILLATARPELRAPWPIRAHHAQITVGRLSDEQIRGMVHEVAVGTRLSARAIEALVQRSTGVPLFVEELTRAVLESRERVGALEIPTSLNDSLMARLDRLGPAKEVAQVGSALGRDFDYPLLRALIGMPEDQLQAALASLCDAELLLVQGFPPEAVYTFKHALIQEAAYQTLLKSRRREIHRRAAEVIRDQFQEVEAVRPELLARHWTAGGEGPEAVSAWTRAGDLARRRHAFNEAEEDYRQALAIVDLEAPSPERMARELELTSALLLALSVTKGYAAPETIRTAERARALAEVTGDFRHLFIAVTGAGNAAVTAGEYHAAADLADRALELAQREQRPTFLAIARRLQLETRFYRGDPLAAEEHFSGGREFFDDPRFRRGSGSVASAFGHAAFAVWALGRGDVARARCAEALANARELHSPFDQAFALIMDAVLHVQMREPEQAEASAVEAIALSDQHGFPQWGAVARIALGSARATLGHPSEGISLIRQGVASATDIGARVSMTIFLASLAEAYALAGALQDALETVEQALHANPEEAVWRPHSLAVRAELHFRANRRELAEADVREAIAVAHKMGARSYELRAVIVLARWAASPGARTEARNLLQALYEEFESGLDTRDLREARRLLGELG